MTLAEFWPQCLSRMKKNLSEQQFNTWIAPLTVGEEGQVWVIYSKNQFTCNMLQNQFATQFNTIRAELAPNQTDLMFKVGMGMSFAVETPETPRSMPSAPQTVSTTPAETVPVSHSRATPTINPKQQMQDLLSKHLNKENNGVTKVQNASSTQNVQQAETNKTPVATSEKEHKEHNKDSRLNHLSSENTFATLVQGKGNRMAVAAAQAIAEHTGKRIYNPFFLYGSTGLGKTHLVQAIANQFIANHENAKVCYIHASEYVRDMMQAFRQGNHDAFKHKYQKYDLLIIDDIQFIKNKDRTMEEFFYLYNHFHDHDKQLILTCDTLPSKLDGMDERLISRFSWGLTVELEPPEFEMRVDILQKKAELAGIVMTEQVEEALEFVADHIRANVRELEGALKKIMARSMFSNTPISRELAREALKDVLLNTYKPINSDLVIEVIAKAYNLRISDLTGKKRNRNIARPRQIVMCLLKELTSLSYKEIGDALGGRDHSTVIHGVEAIEKLRQESLEFNQEYERLLKQIQN